MTNKLLERAWQQYQQGRLEEALETYQQILQEEPEQASALHGTGIILSQLGHPNEALQCIDRAIQLEPKNSAFQNSRGNALSHLGQLIEATVAYDHAIQLEPDAAIYYNNLGNCFSRQKKWDNAEKAYLKAIALKPNFANPHFNYARLLVEFENYHKAIAELKKALAIEPNYTTALGQLAHVYMYQSKYTEAITHYEKRLTLEPQNANAQFDCGLAYLKNNQFQKAADRFKTALSLNPDHPDSHYGLATAYVQLGEHKEALTHYLRQLEKSPRPECYYNIGVLHMYQERHRDAIDYFKQALEMESNYLEAHLNMAAVYLKMGLVKQAIEHYQTALTLKPDDAEITHILTALQEKETPATAAPTAYVQHLFDEYAAHYDQHLTLHLQYQAPQKLYQSVALESDNENPQWKILDLGCGTGLCGEYFKPLANELIGVDLSEKMLMIAKNKNIYDKLENKSLQEALEEYNDLDLILAGDVFTYLGDLEDIFKKAKNALAANGLFAFTVEKTKKSPYELKQTIRYAHSKKYLKSLIKKNRFEILRLDNVFLRTHKKKPVEGYLIILRN